MFASLSRCSCCAGPIAITEVRKERGDTTTLVMQPDGHPGFRFSPGQFGWLTVWGSPFKITGHPFSFSSSAEATDGRVEMSIRNWATSRARCTTCRWASASISMGRMALSPSAIPADMHVLIAGGVGITPMMSMIRTLADRGDRRPVILLYGSKDWDLITFREELEALKARLNLTVVHVLRESAGRLDGRTGLRQRRDVQAPSAAAIRRPRVFHLRTQRDDGRD